MKKVSPKLIITMTCSVFLIFGLFNSAIGPSMADLADQTNSSLAVVGGVLTFLFMGALVSMSLAGALTDRFGQKYVIIISLSLLTLGILGFTNARSLPWLFALFILTGLGQGGMEVGANLVVTEAYPKNNTGILNLLHFFYGFGAFIGPAVVSLVISYDASPRLVQWIAAGAFLVLAFLFLVFYANKKRESGQKQAEENGNTFSVYRSPLLWITGILLLTYVGIEFGLGNWSTTFMGISANMPIEKAALVTSGYWGFLTLGRLLAALLSKKLSTLQLLGYAVIGSLVGGVAFLLFTGTIIPIIVAILVIGFCFGTIYPTTIAVAANAFGKNQGKAVGLVSAFGSIGGLALPWVGGVMLVNGGVGSFNGFVIGVLTLQVIAFLLVVLFHKKHIHQ